MAVLHFAKRGFHLDHKKSSTSSPRLLIACDKFKGSLTSTEVNRYLSQAIQSRFPDLNCQRLDLSDGGDGMLAALGSIHRLELRSTQVRDPLGRSCLAQIGMDQTRPGHSRAFLAAHQANGLQYLSQSERNPLQTSSAGVGDLLLAAYQQSVSEIYLGLGGSATSDGGVGALQALGFVFKDAAGQSLDCEEAPARKLMQIKSIQGPSESFAIPLTLLTDVSNPALGPRGAARVYAPQKGASPTQVEFLETGLQNWLRLLEAHSGRKLKNIVGGGAAGALALGLHVLLDAKITSGAAWFLKQAQAEKRLQEVDWLITGEGRFDASSLEGKITGQVLEMAKSASVKSLLLTGQLTADIGSVADYQFTLPASQNLSAESAYQQIQTWVASLPADFWG